jgi:YD repeat-containing protein
MQLFAADTKLALLAFFSEDNRSSVSHSTTPLRTNARSFHSYSAAPFIPPTISLTTPTNNANFIAGATITLSANALDSDGTISKVEFFRGAVKLGEDTTAPYAYDWTNVAAGDYVLTARATDNAGEITTSAAINISVLAQVKQYVGWSAITNGIDLGNGSVRKTSSGAWDFYSGSLQTLLAGDGYFESTAATYNQSINLGGTDGSGRAVVIGSGGWVGIYENNVLVAATSSNPPVPIISAHIAGDRYRIEITNSILRYIRYRSSAREVMFTSTATLPVYPISVGLGMSPQNAEWQKTVLAQLTQKATWSSITNGISLGNGSVKKTSTGVWDFSANAAQTLLRGDGYFESTASMYNQSINLSGTDGASRSLVIGSGGWAAVYENGAEITTVVPHAAGDRYRVEISNGSLRYVRYRSGIRSVLYTSTNGLPAYPMSLGLGASPQNAEWQNTIIAQLSQTVAWSYINNGIDLGNGSVRKTSAGVWDFSAGPRQQLVCGNGYFESTASSFNHSISLGGVGGDGAIVAGTGGWAAIYEMGQEVANTYPMQNIAPHAAGDRYRLEISRNKLRYVRYRAGVRTLMFTSNNPVPGYALGFGLGASWQDTEWQNTIFSDNMPEHNDASFVSQTVPTTMVPGQTYSVSVTMRNTGASTWTPDGDYQLASENLPDNQRWGLNRVNLTTTVLPGSDATFNFTVTAPATGSHSFQWRMVQQGVERFGTLSTNVTVQTVNNPPTVSLSSPMNNQVFTAGTTVQLAANASDTGGSITKVEFFQGTTKLGEDTTSPYTYNWTNVPAGSYVLTARATDNGGATATSNAVNITVNTPNVPPTVTIAAPTNNATFANDTTITITANAVDSDGIVNKVEFFRGGTTKLGEDTNGTDGFSYSWANVQAGPYSLTVKATDNSGAITTSSGVSITVSLPVVSVASTDADASEPGSNTGVFTVSRTGGTSMQLTVNFSVSGTAVAGTDYTSVGTAVTIPIGAASRTIVITPIDDTAIEGNETATLTVSSNAAYTLGTPTSATVTIADNDHYTPIVSITSPVGGATFTTPATINITANASEQNGTISKVEFFQGATKLGEDTNGADGFSYAWTNVPDGSYSLTARATDSYGVAVTSAAVQVNVLNFNLARLDPLNRTGGSGEDPLSRNFNWSVGLVGLSGRAGLDLGLSLAYNSLVWTKSGSYIAFDNDRGFPSPGFRLGFPVIQPAYNNSEVGKQAFLLITPDGSHTELRQVGTSSFYESADSSHLLLDASDGNTMILRTTDGTQLSYAWQGSDFQCTQIKDRNGNFISINYTGFGRIDTVVDTLARTIKFNYDGSNYLTSITQTWTVNGLPQTHTWASFNYSNPNILIQTNFTGLTNLGPQNGSTLKVLTRATLSDNSHYNFEYTSWGQVWKISEYAPDNNLPPDSHLLNYRAYNLRGSPMQPTGTEPDCPRFTERHDWAENWNRSGSPGSAGLPAGPEQEVITNYSVPPSGSWTMPDGTSQTGTIAQVTLPDNTYHKMYFAGSAGTSSGWQRGLPMLVETYDSEGVRQRQAATLWTQDNTTVSYLLNPRVLETNTYDPAGNRARLSVTYQSANFADGTSCRLPQDVYEYQANATTVLRRTHTDYNLATTYTDRRIIGLASEKRLYEVDPNTQAETLMSKVGFAYDAGSIQGNDAPVQHDNANYAQGFTTGRANLTSVTRFDVNNTLPSTTSTMTYNTSGSVVKTIDPANHQVLISYTDQFAANGTTLDAARPATCAFPTMVTDPDGFTVSSRYHYDFGAATWKQTPQPNTTVNLPGPEQTLTYDSIGRIQRTTNLVNGAYTRYVYPGTQPGSQNRLDVYSRILDEANEQNGLEAHSFSIADGHGRTIASASSHPGSVGGFSGQLILYDAMGRAIKSSNPAETSASGTPTQWAVAGDDASPTGLGWLYTQQTYDWKGRPLVTTNTDLTTKEASYGGCGCAGGQVVTLTDEGTIDGGVPKRRQQKIYADVLGRTVKTEVLNWQGGTAYATTVNTYNARDQVTLVRQYAGAEGSATYQDTTMAYDGYGRLKTKHVPQQNTNSVTTYNYNDDDTVLSVVDGRGATCTYGYNNRHQVTSVAHTLSGYDPINIGYVYDAAGNRTSMSHSVNSVAKDSAAYVYDQLSRMTSETRHINALEGSSPNYGNFTMGYGYTLSSELQSVTDAFSSTTNLSYDVAGRTQSVSGSYGGTNYTYASNVGYRAWGAVKAATFGDNTSQSVPQFNARMQPTQFRLTNGNRYDYSYYDDGRLKQLTDLDDQVGDPHTVQFHYMSRSYQYDQAARIAGVGPMSPNPNSVPAPFTGNYGYDEFNNMTSRSGHYALNSDRYDPGPNWDSPPATYTNNRRVQSGWAYDADGRVTTSSDTSDAGGSSTRTWIYDAAGELITVSETRNGTTTTNSMAYDGDGQLLYESVSGATSDYLIRSAVLGTVLTKLDATGNKNTTYVPTNGLVAAMQQKDYQGNPTMSWVHRDASGLQETGKAYDPFGNLIPNVQPPVVGPPPYMPFYGATYGGASWNSFTNANNFSGGCNSAANNNPALCNDRMLELMGAEFVSNLPGQHDDMWQGENDHISRLNGPHDDPNNNGGAIWLPPDDSIPGRFGNWALVAGHVRKESMLPQEPNIPPLRLTDPTKELRLKHSFSDARNVLTTKGGNAKTKAAIKKCLDFFTQGISVDEALNILENFGATASYDYRLGESTARTANSGGKMAATVRLGDPFFADDNIGIKGTGLTWNPQYNVYVTMQNLTPRQNRSLTILHEFAHALGLLPHDGRDVDPTGKMSAQNDATIFEKCGDLIDAIVPWRD